MGLVTLRLRGPGGVTTVQIAPDASLFELQASVFSVTSIAPEEQQIRTGHPPRILDTTSDQNATVSSLGLRNGDVLTVQKGQPGTAATSSTGKTLSQRQPSAKPSAAAEPSDSSSTGAPFKATAPPAPLSPPTASATLSVSKPRQVRTDNEVPEGTLTTAAANRKLPVKPPILHAGKSADDVQPARNARPQQPFAPPVGSTAPSGAKPGLASTEDAHVKVDGGWMVLRVVPDDNSCMFTALAILLEHDRTGAIQGLRESVAESIRSDPGTWSDAVLGMKPSTYCEKIIRKETWGGAIELAILSKKYNTEIISIDVQSGRADRRFPQTMAGWGSADALTPGFGEEHQYENHILLIYSGIHYDAVTFTPLEPKRGETYPYSLEFDQTIFSHDTEGFALAATTELARKLRDRHYYTDTAGFALRCEICKTALKGEKEAQAHAKRTGHTNFGEF